MKFGRHALGAAGAALLAAAGHAAAQADAVNIMWFGNSHTCGFAGSCPANTLSMEPRIPEVVRLLARFAGETEPTNYWQTQNGAAIISGFRVAADRAEDVPEGEWDFVVMQGNAQENLPAASGLGNPQRFQNLALCTDWVFRQHSPGVTAVMFQTWARAHEHPNYAAQGGPIADPEAYHRSTRASYRKAHGEITKWAGLGASRVARVGDAFALADWNNDNGSPLAVISQDNNHAVNRGSLLAALVLFGTIFEVTDLAGLGVDAENGASELEARLRSFGIDQDDFDYVAGLAEQVLADGGVGCTPADIAEPFGSFDVIDVLAFMDGFENGDINADLEPAPAGGDGEHNILDVLRFISEAGVPCDAPEPPCG